MKHYTTITKATPETLEIFGLDFNKEYLADYHKSVFYEEGREIDTLENLIARLAIKNEEEVEIVRFKSGNIGIVADYNGKKNGFEIIG